MPKQQNVIPVEMTTRNFNEDVLSSFRTLLRKEFRNLFLQAYYNIADPKAKDKIYEWFNANQQGIAFELVEVLRGILEAETDFLLPPPPAADAEQQASQPDESVRVRREGNKLLIEIGDHTIIVNME